MFFADTILYIYVLITGTMIGSFINCAVYRIPLGKSILWPGSFCTCCKAPVMWYHNIPVISWFLLRGKCASCGEPFSIRYPAVEFFFGILLLVLFASKGGLTVDFIFLSLLCIALVMIFFIDLDHYIIPDSINFPFLAIGLVYSWYVREDILNGLIGGVSGFAIFFLLYILTKGRGMGFGDVKMIAMLGVWFGWLPTLFIIMISSILGSLVGVAMMFFGNAKLKTALPYGTFLAIAGGIMIFFEGYIINTYGLFLP